MKNNKEHWRAFTQDWFLKHQKRLIYWLNFPVIGWLFKKMMRINLNKIDLLLPHATFYGVRKDNGKTEVTADFRVHDKYSKRIYYAFKPIWWILHYWDALFADKFLPKLSFGFDSLTKYPQAGAGGGNVTCDGTCEWGASSPGKTWAQLMTTTDCGFGGANTSDSTNHFAYIVSSTTSGYYTTFYRSFFGFDTSTIGAGSTISDAVMSIYATSNVQGMSGLNLNIVKSTTAVTNTLSDSDIDNITKDSLAGDFAQSDISINSYNAFTFNTDGKAFVSKTGVTKTATVFANDTTEIAPTWVSGKITRVIMRMADNTGTAQDPKLVVTYTAGGSDQPAGFVQLSPNF